MKKSSKRELFGSSVGVAAVGVGLIVTALATDNWVKAKPHNPLIINNTLVVGTGSTEFGLFHGQQSLHYLTHLEENQLKVACKVKDGLCAYIFMKANNEFSNQPQLLIDKYQNNTPTNVHHGNLTEAQSDKIYYGLFSFPLWVSTIIFLALAVVMGLVTIGFTTFNIFGRPIETITGPFGLYIWNSVAFLFTTVALALFAALYHQELAKNFLMYEDYDSGWRSDKLIHLDYSYFLLIGAACAFFMNIVLLSLFDRVLSCSKHSSSVTKQTENVDGVILY